MIKYFLKYAISFLKNKIKMFDNINEDKIFDSPISDGKRDRFTVLEEIQVTSEFVQAVSQHLEKYQQRLVQLESRSFGRVQSRDRRRRFL